MKRKPLRLKNYDYSKEGAYFVTVCTKNACDYFGRIKEGRVILNNAGQMIERIWNEISVNYSGINLDVFIIMPNHVHGIIIIDNVGAGPRARPNLDKIGPAQEPAHTDADQLSLSNIVHRFKSLTTASYRKEFADGIIHFNGKLWHRSFYEHIIRNNADLNRTCQYIINNPIK